MDNKYFSQTEIKLPRVGFYNKDNIADDIHARTNSRPTMKPGDSGGEVTTAKNSGSAPTWDEFVSTTTIHGVKFIFDQKPLRSRRFLWAICVLGAITIFSYQVFDRVSAYLSHKSNVNLEVIYTDNIPFPSVTICNQNNYRITEAGSLGVYEYLDQFYSSDGHFESKLPDTANKYTLENFTAKMAHQLNEFINSCWWKGKPCNIDTDFIKMNTNFGVCWTFNSNLPSKNVTQSGAGFGLSLILNIEQYEYMRGPQDEAGIKVLLHDPAEVPLVKDLGFAVAPGTHTLIGVQRSVVKSLVAPYGHCVERAPPVSTCLLECRTMESIKRCGCRDVYMNNLSESKAPTCNVSDAFTCVSRHLSTFTEEDISCNCSAPCDRVNYEPMLSYAHLSKLSVDRLFLSNTKKTDHVTKHFIQSREIKQRVLKQIATKDNKLIAGIKSQVQKYENDVTHMFMIFKNDNWIKSGKSNKMLDRIIVDDLILLGNIFLEKSKEVVRKFPDLSKIRRSLYNYLRSYFHTSRTFSRNLIQQLLHCLNRTDETHTDDAIFTGYYYDCNEKLEHPARTLLINARRAFYTIWSDMHIYEEEIGELQNQYTEKIEYLFGSPGLNISEKHKRNIINCKEIIMGVQNEAPNILRILKFYTENYINATNMEQQLEAAYNISEVYTWLSSNVSFLTQDTYAECNWYLIPYREAGTYDKTYKKYQEHVEVAGKTLADAKSQISPLMEDMRHTIREFAAMASTVTRPLDLYLNSDITKTELHAKFNTNDFKTFIDQMKYIHKNLLKNIEHYMNKLKTLENHYMSSMTYVDQFTFTVFNDSVTELLNVKQISGHLTSHQIRSFNDILSNMTTYKGEYFVKLAQELLRKYRNSIEAAKIELQKSFSVFTELIESEKTNLHLFVKGNAIDESFFRENYIKLDIFYKSLSYEQISQQEAFEFLSLLSEIGGSLSLLLGASVLTMCELLDYLVLSLFNRCCDIGTTGASSNMV